VIQIAVRENTAYISKENVKDCHADLRSYSNPLNAGLV
jgi:hypothetical protein